MNEFKEKNNAIEFRKQILATYNYERILSTCKTTEQIK